MDTDQTVAGRSKLNILIGLCHSRNMLVASSSYSAPGRALIFFAILVVGLAMMGCRQATGTVAGQIPDSLGETETSYSYIPLDPLPVTSSNVNSLVDECKKYLPVLDSLPDEAVRIAVGSYDATGSLTFGPAKLGVEKHTYQVILDYIDVDEATLTVQVRRTRLADKTPVSVFDNSIRPDQTSYRLTPGSAVVYSSKPVTSNSCQPNASKSSAECIAEQKKRSDVVEAAPDRVSMPVYIGVGLRLTATVRVLKGTANLSSLGALAAGAEAGNLSGSLVVQTLGINGKGVSTALPLPSELNQTTIQNAILALGAIKAILYDEKNTRVTPRVVGIYNSVGGGQQYINGVIAALATDPVTWDAKCEEAKSPAEIRAELKAKGALSRNPYSPLRLELSH
jgi:hypothetical protein